MVKIEEILQQIGRELEGPQFTFDVEKYKIFPFIARLTASCAYNGARNKGWLGLKEDPGGWDNYLSEREADLKNGILAGAGWGEGPVYNFELLTWEEQERVCDLREADLTAEEAEEYETLLKKCRES